METARRIVYDNAAIPQCEFTSPTHSANGSFAIQVALRGAQVLLKDPEVQQHVTTMREEGQRSTDCKGSQHPCLYFGKATGKYNRIFEKLPAEFITVIINPVVLSQASADELLQTSIVLFEGTSKRDEEQDKEIWNVEGRLMEEVVRSGDFFMYVTLINEDGENYRNVVIGRPLNDNEQVSDLMVRCPSHNTAVSYVSPRAYHNTRIHSGAAYLNLLHDFAAVNFRRTLHVYWGNEPLPKDEQPVWRGVRQKNEWLVALGPGFGVAPDAVPPLRSHQSPRFNIAAQINGTRTSQPPVILRVGNGMMESSYKLVRRMFNYVAEKLTEKLGVSIGIQHVEPSNMYQIGGAYEALLKDVVDIAYMCGMEYGSRRGEAMTMRLTGGKQTEVPKTAHLTEPLGALAIGDGRALGHGTTVKAADGSVLGVPSYRAVLIMSKAAAAKHGRVTRETLRKLHFGYNETTSWSGYRAVRFALGCTEPVGFFARSTRTGSHKETLQNVIRGDVDVGSLDSVMLHLEVATDPSLMDKFVVCNTLPEFSPGNDFPAPPFVASTRVPPELRHGIALVLADMHNERDGWGILHDYGMKCVSQVTSAPYAIFSRERWDVETVISHAAERKSKL